MSHRMVLTISDDHYKWLDNKVRKKRGLENVQEAIRSILEDSYSLDKRQLLKNIDKRTAIEAVGAT